MSVLLDPRGQSQVGVATLAPRRLATLDGARVGFMVSGKHNSDKLLEAIGRLLEQRYRLKSTLTIYKPVATRLAPPQQMEEAVANCDVVFHAIGD